jgi:hypothetical protein
MAFIGIYTRNKQEMHDLKYILVGNSHLVEENKNYQCVPSFPLKTIRRHLINKKLNYNFQIFN